MSEYGHLQEVVTDPRATALTVAASISDTELVVDSAGDFDDESGGTLQLNGAQLEYTTIEWGVTEDDSDTILLAEPLAAAADIDDAVVPIIGGLPAEDWYAMVDMGLGDPVPVPLDFAQRTQWPEGPYDPPVPVTVSEDLSHIEDAPGRPATAGARVLFRNVDTATASGPGDIDVTLTYIPIDGSEHVYWNGILQPPTEWVRVGKAITLADPDSLLEADDEISAAYAYDGAAAVIERPPLTAPPSIELVGVTTDIDGTSSLALPAGTAEGDLMVFLAEGWGSASSADARLTGDAGVAGGTGVAMWGLADASGTALSVSVDASAFNWGAAILAVYRGVDVADFDINYIGASPGSFHQFSDAYAVLGLAVVRSGFTAGDISDPLDTTSAFTSDAVVNDGKAHVGIGSWDSASPVTSPPGNVTKGGDIADFIFVTLLLEAT